MVVEASADAATLSRLAAAAGMTARLCAAGDLPTWWRGVMPLVLDETTAARCVAARMPRRERVLVVVTTGHIAPSTWQDAIALGADAVLSLGDEVRVAHWLAGIAEPDATGRLLCCLSARGGAGASTLATALALAASADADTLLVDADLRGGGVDYLLGLEGVDGARWPQLSAVAGVLPAAALTESLPAAGRLRVLAARVDGSEEPSLSAITSVIEAGLRGHALVIADVDPASPAVPLLTSYAAATLLVVPCEVRACVAAAALARDVSSRCDDVRVVARPGPADLRPSDVSAAVGAPVVAVWPWERRLAAVTESGRLHSGWRRTRIGAIAGRLLAELAA